MYKKGKFVTECSYIDVISLTIINNKKFDTSSMV